MKRKKTDIETAKSWCFKNEIIIYPVPINATQLKIEIDYKGKIIPGEQIFNSKGGKKTDAKWWTIIDELYKDYHTRGAKP